MEIVGLDFRAYKDRLIFTLSGGERRKVALASTLALKPELLLLDEPTAGLDPSNRRDLLEKLKVMQSEGMTIILSSHQMEVLSILAHNLTIFHDGRGVLTGESSEIFSQQQQLEEYGLEPPAVFQVLNGFRMNGFPLSLIIADEETLSRGIADLLL